MLNMKLTGSHAGVSIGEDGPSQMALEDLAMMRAIPNAVVLYPCDAVSTERLVAEMAQHKGLAYMRTSRPKTPVSYGPDERFPIGGSKVLRQSAGRQGHGRRRRRHGVRGAQGLRHPQGRGHLDPRHRRLLASSRSTRRPLTEGAKAAGGVVITVEDHYAAGGLGDAVAEALAPSGVIVERLAVRDIPRSGEPEELVDKFGLSARHIVEAVKGK